MARKYAQPRILWFAAAAAAAALCFFTPSSSQAAVLGSGVVNMIGRNKKRLLGALIGLFLPFLALAANPNNGNLAISPSSFTGSLAALNNATITLSGSPIYYQIGVLRIFDNNGNEYVSCTQPLNSSTTFRLGDYFGEISYMPAGDYTLMVFTTSGTPDCTYDYAYTLSQMRAAMGESADIPITISGYNPPVLTFYNPAASSTVNDINYFSFNGTNFPSSTTSYQLKVDYSNSGASSTIFQDSGNVTSTNSTPFFQVAKTRSFDIFPSSTQWVASAELDNASGTLVYTVPLISFTYDAGLPPSGELPPPSSTSTTLGITCETNSGVFSYSFCYLFQYLFMPSAASINNFSNLKAQFEHKPPFGYFGSISAALQDFNNGTSSIILMDASTTTALAGVFSPVRTGLTWIFWFLMAFWVFHKFRTIEL